MIYIVEDDAAIRELEQEFPSVSFPTPGTR